MLINHRLIKSLLNAGRATPFCGQVHVTGSEEVAFAPRSLGESRRGVQVSSKSVFYFCSVRSFYLWEFFNKGKGSENIFRGVLMSLKSFRFLFLVFFVMYCVCMIAAGISCFVQAYPETGFFTIAAIVCLLIYFTADRINEYIRRKVFRKKFPPRGVQS